MKVADKTYYLNADKTKALPAKSVKAGEDGTPDGAAYLLVREGGEISDEDAEKYGVKLRKEKETEEDQNIVVSGTTERAPAVVEVDHPADEGKKGAKKGK